MNLRPPDAFDLDHVGSAGGSVASALNRSGMCRHVLNFSAIASAPVAAEPFPFLTATGVLDPVALSAINADFPDIRKPGIFPVSDLVYGRAFEELVEDIEGAEIEALLSDKFDVNLSGRPLMVTVRGFCRARDGRIHNDSKDKVVTSLLYLNVHGWNADGGRLRFLRNDRDLDSTIAEIAPDGGNFVAFRRTEDSWHGHHSYAGPRRYVMFNWLVSDGAFVKNVGRHKLSAAFKRISMFDSDY